MSESAPKEVPVMEWVEIRRFWEKVEKTENCWNWTGALGHTGYGTAWIRGFPYRAHRVSMLLSGTLTPGKHALHTCDNRRCVNPAHLFEGTHDENMKDAKAKGKFKNNGGIPPHFLGSEHANAKLSEDQVRAIRLSSSTNAELARLYSVTPQCIHRIRKRLCWTHIE